VLAISRVLLASAAGAVAFGIAIPVAPWQIATLVGWNVAAIVFMVWVWLRIGGMDAAATAADAMVDDGSRPTADLVILLASGASLVVVGLAFLKASGEEPIIKGLITTVALLSGLLSWAVVHTVFALQYASLYYLRGGGVDFNDEGRPDYGDFAYLAFTIGMTYQVSDTALKDRAIRRTALRHALLSFVFGTSVLAMTINVVAGLLFD
jgi:uncharacterized membrane protein